MTDIERVLIERYLAARRRRLFVLLRWRLERLAYSK